MSRGAVAGGPPEAAVEAVEAPVETVGAPGIEARPVIEAWEAPVEMDFVAELPVTLKLAIRGNNPEAARSALLAALQAALGESGEISLALGEGPIVDNALTMDLAQVALIEVVPPLRRWHFSGEGPSGIGFCASVRARSEETAVAALREALPEQFEVPTNGTSVEYVTVYFHREQVDETQIDEINEID